MAYTLNKNQGIFTVQSVCLLSINKIFHLQVDFVNILKDNYLLEQNKIKSGEL